jgi:hypothetical protein
MNKSALFLLLPFFIAQSASAQIVLPTPSRIAYEHTGPLIEVDASADLRTARERALDENFPMPQFGVKETLAVLGQRLNYIGTHGWLNAQSLAMLSKQQSLISQRLYNNSPSSSLGNIANQIYTLNQDLTQSTVLDEQAQPGKDGLLAREMMIRQKMLIARDDGTLNLKKYSELNNQLASINEALESSEMDGTQTAELTRRLAHIAGEVGGNASSGLASQGTLPQ